MKLLLAAVAVAGCVAPAVPEPPAVLAPPPAPIAPAVLEDLATQGALIHGRVEPGVALTLDDRPVEVAPDGGFVIGLDRDAGLSTRLVQQRADGAVAEQDIAIAPRAWRIERVDAPYRAGSTSAEFERLRPVELQQIAAARARVTGAAGWRQRFRWPAIGRLSGWFGAQRVYQGRPGSYHSGVDVALPTGAPVRAPADGVVVLATPAPFTLEGRLLIVDHGGGLSSAFLHLSRIDVAEGQAITRGEVIAAVGATGRVTGPHLHWGVQWRGSRLDPLLVAGPVPTQ